MAGLQLSRPKAPQTSDPNLACRLNLLWKYLDVTGLQKCMEELCVQLLGQTELPQNPYLRFVRQLQQQSERFHLTNSMPTERILSDLNFPTFATAIGYISGARNSSHVWGLPSVLRCVSPAHVKQYSWLLDNVTPSHATLHHTSAYTVQVLPALTGLAIFTGTFYDLPPSVDILLIFVIIGPNYQKAISLYTECVRNDIIRIIKQQKHLVFRLVVPVDKNGQNKVFSKGEVMKPTEDFSASIMAAVTGKQLLRLECLWRLNAAGDDFRRGAKLYGLSAVQSSAAIGGERMFDFSELPLIHLYSSVFLQRTHAEAYYGISVPRDQAIDTDLQQPRMKATYKSRGGERARDTQRRIPTPSKVLLHGFQYSVQGKDTPDCSTILEPVRESLVRRIARTPLTEGAFDIAYLSILITLTQLGNAGNQEHGSRMTDKDLDLQEALIQLHRFLHGSASQMWNILNVTQTICMLLETDNNEVECGAIYSVLAEKSRKLILDFLNSGYRKVSSDFTILSRVWKRGMELALDGLSHTPHGKLLGSFKTMLWYGTVLLIQSVEDSLPWVRALTDMKKQAETTFCPTSPENDQITEDGKHAPYDVPGLLYGRDQYINVAESASNVQSPELSQPDVVLTKYCVDCRLDWHWEQCLQGIFSESPLPPNPYPIAASEFIKASLRMDLWQKQDEEIVRQVFQFTPKLIDGENHIFQVPGMEVFGLRSAVGPLNPTAFQTVLGLISTMANKNFPQRYQGFKVVAGLAVNSSATWFGTLSPFLNVLELTEFYYLKGPPGCHREALQAYAKIVHSHLKELQQQLKGLLIFTVWLSKGQRWSAHDLLTYPSAFIEAFVEGAANGHRTYLKVLQSSPGSPWHCLPILKDFVLYYFEDQEESWLSYPRHDPIGLHQNIFLSKETAAFHCQRVGSAGDPFRGTNLQEVMMGLNSQILKSFLKDDLLSTYRLAAAKCLIGQRYDVLAACWRMMHSVAAQLEHLNRLNETIQELLSVEKANGIKPTRSTGGSAGIFNSALPKVLEEALLWYQRLLKVTLDNQSCPAPCSLSDVALTRLRAVSARDGGTGSLDLLKEVAVMCQAVSDVTVWEVHALCPEMRSLLRSLDQRASTVPPTITAPEPQRSGAVTPDTRPSDQAAAVANTSREALEGW